MPIVISNSGGQTSWRIKPEFAGGFYSSSGTVTKRGIRTSTLESYLFSYAFDSASDYRFHVNTSKWDSNKKYWVLTCMISKTTGSSTNDYVQLRYTNSDASSVSNIGPLLTAVKCNTNWDSSSDNIPVWKTGSTSNIALFEITPPPSGLNYLDVSYKVSSMTCWSCIGFEIVDNLNEDISLTNLTPYLLGGMTYRLTSTENVRPFYASVAYQEFPNPHNLKLNVSCNRFPGSEYLYSSSTYTNYESNFILTGDNWTPYRNNIIGLYINSWDGNGFPSADKGLFISEIGYPDARYSIFGEIPQTAYYNGTSLFFKPRKWYLSESKNLKITILPHTSNPGNLFPTILMLGVF